MNLKIIENATCTFCGCVCDDIELHHDEVRIHKAKHACVLGTSWFLNHTAEHKYPDALIAGKEAIRELIQEKATVDGIGQELSRLINDLSYRNSILSEYEKIYKTLDTGSASENTAKLMMGYLAS